jgi:signal transduction histidine kinase
MLSHELRTPLTSIVGWVSMLRRQGDELAVRARAIDSIDRNAALQLRLVDDVLEISRIVTGKLQLDRRPVDLAGIVRISPESSTLRSKPRVRPPRRNTSSSTLRRMGALLSMVTPRACSK